MPVVLHISSTDNIRHLLIVEVNWCNLTAFRDVGQYTSCIPEWSLGHSANIG